jgi:hypothetical protein
MKQQMISSLIGLLALGASSVGFAKLPALGEEAKAKAAEAAAKTAWAGKVDSYQLCKSQDKVAASYFQKVKATGKDVKAPTATPACTDPGGFSYTPPEAAKPVEAAGAHSPAATAAGPPSGPKSDSAVNPAKKP